MKFIFLIACLIFCKSVFAQIDIISESVIHPDSNVLFIGIDNHLIIKGAKIKNHLLRANNSQISKWEDYFTIRVSEIGRITLKLYRNKKLVLSKPFRVETIPPPKAQLGRITDTVAKVSEILANPLLHVVIPKSSYKHEYMITEFRLIVRRGVDTLSISGSAPNIISKSQLEIIKQLVPGDELLFNNIYGTCPSCVRSKFPSFSVRIK